MSRFVAFGAKWAFQAVGQAGTSLVSMLLDYIEDPLCETEEHTVVRDLAGTLYAGECRHDPSPLTALITHLLIAGSETVRLILWITKTLLTC